MSKFLNISTDNTLGGNSPSDVLVASQKAIKEYVDSQGGGGSVDIDNNTITTNTSDEIQAVAVIDQNTGIAKTWTGTMAEYEAIVTKDPETEYIITDDIGGPATVIAELAEGLNDKVDVGHQVIAFQEPTSANNYTWYRKYADGWVEQGGVVGGSSGIKTINLPVTMANNKYQFMGNVCITTYNNAYTLQPRVLTTATVQVLRTYGGNGYGAAGEDFWWQVSGMAA